MAASSGTVMAIKSYQSQADILVKNYLLSAPYIPYTSVLGGLVASKLAYDFTQLISTFYIKVYSGLTKVERVEWNNRGMSSIHAFFITALSLYLVFWSDLFADQWSTDFITLRSSQLSNFGLGVSVGYFVADIGMIFWFYPSLGGMEYRNEGFLPIIPYLIFFISCVILFVVWRGSDVYIHVSYLRSDNPRDQYEMVSGYSWFEEIHFISCQWWADLHCMVVTCQGLMLSSLEKADTTFSYAMRELQIARILLFVYMFHHIYLNYDQVIKMSLFGCLVVFVVPAALFIMNLMWFTKIAKGLMKTLSKRK